MCMESTYDTPIKKLKQNVSLHVAECIRQFELPQQFPSTITELHSSKIESDFDASCMKTQKLPSVSPAPLSIMKFIPTKELPFFNNLKKIKLKLPDGTDVGEVKIVLPKTNENVKAKCITLSNLGKKSETSVTWAIESNLSIEKDPKVETITKILNSSTSKTSVTSQKTSLPNIDAQLISSSETADTGSPFTDTNDSLRKNTNLQKLAVKHSNLVLFKHVKESQVNNLNSCSGPQEKLIKHRSNQIFQPLTNRSRSLKIFKTNLTESDNITNKKKIIFKRYVNNCSLKRDSLLMEDLNQSLSRNPNSSSECVSSNCNSDMKTFYNKSKNFPNILYRNKTLDKNMVKTLDNSAEKSRLTSFHPNFQTDNISNTKCMTTNDEVKVYKKKIQILDKKKELAREKLSILEKAVLTIQDSSLRVKALAALKDCGIKTKKKVPLKRLLNSKIINESQTQTEIFSLLKEKELILVTEKSDGLSRIKQRGIVMKQAINALYNGECGNQIYSKDKEKFKHELDELLEQIFPQSMGLLKIKKVLSESQTAFIKTIMNQLQADLEASISYDDNGYLAIHRAIKNNNTIEVQKNIIILKAVGKSIDICTKDEQTGLELAVDCETDTQIIQLLLNSGAQPVSSKPIHDSAIIIAAKKSSRILPLLFERISQENRSLLNLKNSEGFAAIHYCAQRGNLNGIIELLKHGAEVNLQDERSGKTALFYAVDTKNCDIPQDAYYDTAFKLLEYGAVSNILTFSKHSVLSIIDDIKNHPLKIALNKAIQ
ncbi:uncharacterized protein LOC106641858 [Copidosoma floridanum]|uniref:uncharacterized protein LOC106641858 n=1 Tax=Copidosoma floridanum TaxID=29053 RepID=UPI0006C9CBFC|nr:uncharacterized protein LOC106641858 [Copidosoma floridanum]